VASENADISGKRFLVSVFEIRQELVWADEFAGRYTKTVTLADGSTRTIELTPMVRDGMSVVEFKDTGHRSYMGTLAVRTATTTNGALMVRIADLDDLDAARAEWRSRVPAPHGTLLPPGTSLLTLPDFVPPGFTQGIQILNDDSTPMNFVVSVLGTHLSLPREDANRTMLTIHLLGGVLLPTATLADAERIAALMTAEAGRLGYPLACSAVSIAP